MFSITFDDVPASAVVTGARVLEDAGGRGTFYVATGLAGSAPGGAGERMATLDQVAVLDAAGHLVGCHTYSHRHLAAYRSADELAADCARSRAILSEALGGAPVRHFSFPFGEYSLAAKRRLARDYATLRLTQGGVNRGRTDLTMLRAEQIYSRNLDRDHLAALIDDSGRAGGWLILYTHGVVGEPDGFGVTPQDLRWAVERCAAHGELLTVGDALARVA